MTVTTDVHELLGVDLCTDQLVDIVTHGMAQGVAGFIYSSELAMRFDSHEDEILNYLNEFAFDMGEPSGMQMVINAVTKRDDDAFYSMQDVKGMACWLYVEFRAHAILTQMKHPSVY